MLLGDSFDVVEALRKLAGEHEALAEVVHLLQGRMDELARGGARTDEQPAGPAKRQVKRDVG